MSFFTGLFMTQAFVFMIVFAFVAGIIFGVVLIELSMKETCPETYSALKDEFELKLKEKKEKKSIDE